MSIIGKVEIGILNSYYGLLLTPHQSEMIRLYHDCDISLQEISEQFGISRQAVRDAIVRGEKALLEYEEKLSMYASDRSMLDSLKQVKQALVEGKPASEVVTLVDSIIVDLEE